MNMQLLLGLWGAILIAYVSVTVMRARIARREDDTLHVSEYEQQMVSTQTDIAHRLDVLDKWKTALLILTIVSGVLIAAWHIYNFWIQSSTTPQFS